MQDEGKINGLIIGVIFTLISLMCIWTYIIPMISIIPGMFFESVAEFVLSDIHSKQTGKVTILLLAVALIIIIVLSLLYINIRISKYRSITWRNIIVIMMICYFIVHPLGFYIYWGVKLNFRGDGQLISAAVDSFPITSFSFIILIGLIIDGTANILRKKALIKYGTKSQQL
ncbi:MAG: hypothetical protein QM763_24220 [Agriterribacter sp.]